MELCSHREAITPPPCPARPRVRGNPRPCPGRVICENQLALGGCKERRSRVGGQTFSAWLRGSERTVKGGGSQAERVTTRGTCTICQDFTALDRKEGRVTEG